MKPTDVTLEPESVYDGILSVVGRTPLVRLRKLLPGARFQLYAKLESLNPGGSIKDRPALAILGMANYRVTRIDPRWLEWIVQM